VIVVSPDWWSHTMNSFSNGLDSALWLLTQTYANRSVSLWKIPETLAWLNSTLQAAASEMKSTPRAGLAAFSVVAPSFLRSVIRHAIVSDLKPLAPFIGSILSALGPQEGYDVMQPEGEGVTVYDDEYFSTASAETAKRRREGLSGGRRGGRNDTIEIDLVEFLEMLEAVLALGIDEPRRNETLGALQEGNGAGVVRQLEVRFYPSGLFPRQVCFSHSFCSAGFVNIPTSLSNSQTRQHTYASQLHKDLGRYMLWRRTLPRLLLDLS
jgi:Transcriptional repressor TCF25